MPSSSSPRACTSACTSMAASTTNPRDSATNSHPQITLQRGDEFRTPAFDLFVAQCALGVSETQVPANTPGPRGNAVASILVEQNHGLQQFAALAPQHLLHIRGRHPRSAAAARGRTSAGGITGMERYTTCDVRADGFAAPIVPWACCPTGATCAEGITPSRSSTPNAAAAHTGLSSASALTAPILSPPAATCQRVLPSPGSSVITAHGRATSASVAAERLRVPRRRRAGLRFGEVRRTPLAHHNAADTHFFERQSSGGRRGTRARPRTAARRPACDSGCTRRDARACRGSTRAGTARRRRADCARACTADASLAVNGIGRASARPAPTRCMPHAELGQMQRMIGHRPGPEGAQFIGQYVEAAIAHDLLDAGRLPRQIVAPRWAACTSRCIAAAFHHAAPERRQQSR